MFPEFFCVGIKLTTIFELTVLVSLCKLVVNYESVYFVNEMNGIEVYGNS
jgi:hypothetical protein